MTTRYTALVTTPTTVTTDAPATTGSLRTLGTSNPQNLGVPAPGTATSASASDHVHQMPTAGDVGAISTSALTATAPQALGAVAASGSSSNVARLDHVHPFPTASNVGADPVGSAATAQANAVLAANAYTDASIFAVTTSSGRAKIATTGTVANLSAVTVATLDPPYVPVAGDKILLLGDASPDGVIATSAAYGGLYDVGVVVAGVAPFTRNTNYNTIAEICGASWFVTDGTYSNDFWACTTDPTGAVLNTTPLTFVQFAGALSNNAAQPLGVAASGTSHDVSRADHVHALPTIPALSNAAPQALGVAAAPGSSPDSSRADHVHPFPTAGDVGAVPTTRTVSTTSPLSGGGALSGDLTLSLTLATGSGLENSSGLRIATSAAGTGLTGGGGSALSVSYGISAGTACEGNDARLSNARAPAGSAGGDLGGSYPNPTVTSGANHSHTSGQVSGLGNSATRNVGTSAGTVAAGDDSRITGALQSASNLSDLANVATARTNLGVQDMVRLIPLCPGAQSTTSTVDVVIGGAYFDPAVYAITGRTTVLTLEVVGQVSTAGVTGTLTLYNITAAASAATDTITQTSATYDTASVALPTPAAARTYEVRLKKSGGATTDYVLVYGVNLRVTWS